LVGGAPVACAELDPRQLSSEVQLFDEEAHAVAKAVDKRRQEFTAGRALARQALRTAGSGDAPLLPAPQRVPDWPAGALGSITHTDRWCAAVVGLSHEVSIIGVDVEPDTPLMPELWSRICRPEEQAWLATQDEAQRGVMAKAIFSAKESLYKAHYPRVREFLDFHSVRLELIAPSAGKTWRWLAELQTQWGGMAPGQRLGPGLLSFDQGLVVTALIE
jgi:4'-phosphopantetheinyl transferase EntD